MEETMNGESAMNRVRSLSDLLDESFLQDAHANDSDTEQSEAGNIQDKGITGQQSTIKTLYEGPQKCNCCINWVETPPDDLSPDIEKHAESKKHALLVRMKKDHDSDTKSMTLHSIVVQSPRLKVLLGKVFEHFGGITTDLERLVFKAPFQPFFYQWEQLKEAVQREEDPLTKEHGKLLRKILQAELRDVIALSRDYARYGVIDFANLWTIFKPGIDVFFPSGGHESIHRLVGSSMKCAGDTVSFQLDIRSIDFDGSGFGYKTSSAVIPFFEGTTAVTSLDAYPAHLHPNIGELRQRLHRRGERFRDLQAYGFHYKSYGGMADLALPEPAPMSRRMPMPMPCMTTRSAYVDGRIIVDAEAYNNFNPMERMFLQPLRNDTIISGQWDVSDPTHSGSEIYDDPPSIPHGMVTRGCLGPPPPVSDNSLMRCKQIPDELLYLCGAKVRGFSFKIKKWASFFVDCIQEVKWNETAFDSLVLPSDHKRLMLSFVESQLRNKKHFDDVIEGKGQGIVILLEGSPGVGKTLTAEALADRLRRPLYAMSIAELGRSAAELESCLTMILEVAVKWDAVVLLDEADVFLEKRRSVGGGGGNNLERNGIVAIFLRLLEYFRGVLFMTTNRVRAIDPAFQSRIHLQIAYPDLDVAARRQIWERMVAMSTEGGGQEERSGIGAEELERLARAELNGREIKNLVKSAQLLASFEGVPLAVEHVETVLRVTQKDVTGGGGDE
ncbi:putative 26S protease regulatory subunit-like protein [Lasiodiplodia theobromae]|uniref:Putative 26S protease regulatory subunit-like protein n=1 Tax=Lasiodiplodia theobromae TaxID=45133 RepID=A0A5N5DCZ9_9PEZI|nr:putative 26S protease regulatory subunit-like protein [Lasiodiplodia theobromae]